LSETVFGYPLVESAAHQTGDVCNEKPQGRGFVGFDGHGVQPGGVIT